jgi:hypothetical protein
MSCLDDLPILTADANFYARLDQRLRRLEPAEHRLAAWLFGNLRLGYAFLLVLVLANLATAYFALHGTAAVDYRDQYIESLATQYVPNTTSSLVAGQ